jgi:hypothetical protein
LVIALSDFIPFVASDYPFDIFYLFAIALPGLPRYTDYDDPFDGFYLLVIEMSEI